MPKAAAQLQFDTLAIEGGLFTAEWLGKVASFKAPGQSDADYGVRAGFSTREEIALAWRSAQHLWGQFKSARNQSGFDTWAVSQRFVAELLRQSFGFATLRIAEHPQEIDGRRYPVSHFAHGQAVPLVISACTEPKPLDTAHDRLGDNSGERLRRRSAFGLLQEYVNAADDALWGIASNGPLLRIARDNGSLTRPAWLEADLERLLEEENQAEFSVLWLFLHASRFGSLSPSPSTGEGRGGGEISPHDCMLEQWRNGCRDQGIQARGLLRQNVEQALEDLGQGFVSHPANTALREALGNGNLSTREYFRQLLRLVYRLIFLLTVEERGILHPPDSLETAKGLFERGYSLKRLRDRAVRRSAHDRHHDLWEGLKRVWLGLAEGEPRLALPALGGLFASSQCPALDGARLENRHLLAALFHLAWLRDAPGGPLTRVNWRDMGSEELGSIYESLLELTPQLAHDNRHFSFLEGAATKGNARKTSGSYYTPDSLVQELLDSALEPVIADRLAPHGGALASGEAAVQALLTISVIDPACGSGHFILAAARRLATNLARVLTEGGQPTPDDYRHALRRVVTHCIFGVDLNPDALELTRMALWLEAYTPDAPLGFIDHHLICGNALIGITDLRQLTQGIPDAAFKPLTGDDNDACKALAKENKDILKAYGKRKDSSNLSLALNETGVLQELAALEALPDKSSAEVAAKEVAWRTFLEHAKESRIAQAADIFVGAFLLPKVASTANATIPTSQNLFLHLFTTTEPKDLAKALQETRLASAQALCRQARVLHWPLAFSQVFARGGFSCVLGNPPWERIALEDAEYFAAVAPEIASIDNTSRRKAAILRLQREKPWLWQQYVEDKHFSEAFSGFCQNTSEFEHSAFGRLNTYPLFVERAAKVQAGDGAVGIVVQSGILFDAPMETMCAWLLSDFQLRAFIEFENRERIFQSVHQETRFCLLSFSRTRLPDSKIEFAVGLTNVNQINDHRRKFQIDADDLDLLSPNTKQPLLSRTAKDFTIAKKIYSHSRPMAPRIGKPVANAWVAMTSVAYSEGRIDHCAGVMPGAKPAYEAKLMHQYDAHYATFEGSDPKKIKAGEPNEVPSHKKQEAIHFRYFFDDKLAESFLQSKEIGVPWLLTIRDVTNVNNERTAIAAVVPRGPLMQPLNGISVSKAMHPACVLAAINSLVVDFVARQRIVGRHLNVTTFAQLPFPKSELDVTFVVPRVIELTYFCMDLSGWAQYCGYAGRAFNWDRSRREVLRAELDAYFARAYGLSREDLSYILDPELVMGVEYPSETFRVLKNSEIKEFGEYRTARLVLREFDRMALADAAHEPYLSLLVPPPGQQSSPQYSSIGVMRDEDDARLAGLVMAIIRQAGGLPRQHLTLALTAAHTPAVKTSLSEQAEADRLVAYCQSHEALFLPARVERLQTMLSFFEDAGAIRVEQQGAWIAAIPNVTLPAGLIVEQGTEEIADVLLRAVGASLERQAAEAPDATSQPSTKRA